MGPSAGIYKRTYDIVSGCSTTEPFVTTRHLNWLVFEISEKGWVKSCTPLLNPLDLPSKQ